MSTFGAAIGYARQMPGITLTTLNASYSHPALGLRYLHANMGDLAAITRIREFTTRMRAADIVEALLVDEPAIIGFGVYIWNVAETTEVLRLLRLLEPGIVLIIGGPEVSFESLERDITRLADHIIAGPADNTFAQLCRDIRSGGRSQKFVSALPVDLATLQLPYPLYTDKDLKHRITYVEASRGCPFRCEFCLSSLDKSAEAFDTERFLDALAVLIERGARNFKFIDRTFNLKTETSCRILNFFLDHIDVGLFVHFELVPDRLPAPLRKLLPRFPPGTLQFEIGIQTFNPDVQLRISRRQNNERTAENLRWLRQQTHAHLHTDLIVGLPGEDLASIANSFDTLVELGPQEIQVGVLKRLRGTPIVRHTEGYDMRYAPSPPYALLANRDLDFATMQRLTRFARYWDLVGNSGRFASTLPLFLGDSPFDRFLHFSDWLFAHTHQTHGIALERLFELLGDALPSLFGLNRRTLGDALLADRQRAGMRGVPGWLQEIASRSTADIQNPPVAPSALPAPARQQRHARLAPSAPGAGNYRVTIN